MDEDREGRRIEEELAHHLAELTDELVRSGLTLEQARREAARRFGDPGQVARRTRQVSRGGVLATFAGLRSDLTHATRALARAPVFAVGVMLTLALTLAACVTVFSLVWQVLLRPLAIADPDSLVILLERMPEEGIEASPTSAATFQDWQRDLRMAGRLVAWEWDSWTLADPERPEELIGVRMSPDTWTVLGITPALGRTFTADDDIVEGTNPAVMLSHGYWQRRFGGDATAVGRTVRIDGRDHEVVGILPPRLEVLSAQAEIFLPTAFRPEDPTNRGGRTLTAAARVAPGANVGRLSAEIAALTERYSELYPTSARGWSAHAQPVGEYLLSTTRPRLLAASAGVALLLLVAVVNLANLFLVRTSDRRSDTAVRAALGASGLRLLAVPVLEALLLAFGGAVAGLLLAWGLGGWLVDALGPTLPRSFEAAPGLPAVVVGVTAALCIALTAGMVPAWWTERSRSASSGLALGSRRATRRGTRSRQGLAVAQLGLSAVLLVAAGLLIRTVQAVGAIDVGFAPTGAVAARVSLDGSRHQGREGQRVYYDRLLARVRAIPGVRAAGLTSALPMDPVAANFDLPTRKDASVPWSEAPQVDFRIASPGLDRALGLRILEGRFFDDRDRGGPPVAVVNRSLAESFWPGESAVGKPIQNVWRQDAFFEVIGVVEDTRFYGPTASLRREMFYPSDQVGWGFMTVVARVDGPAARFVAELAGAVSDVDALLPPQATFPVETLVTATTASQRFYAALLAAFALLAVSLAATGVYAVLAYGVRLRRRELGVRLAMGATRRQVTSLVVRSGVLMGVSGAALGVLGAIPATRLVRGMLYGVTPVDPTTFGVVAGLLVLVAIAACVDPAARAARLDPARILQDD
ncbi:MAG: ADOP family duplicated permease [Gemmatimonadota bacterium]